jgi:glucosamine 6-phosphate synthetase-like amidotransferase/phosphosugar isomerase protein
LDTEVLAHLIGEHCKDCGSTATEVHPLAQAVINTLPELVGT